MAFTASDLFATPDVEATHRPDGTIVLASRTPLGAHEPHLGVMLKRWATETPDRLFLAERDPAGGWRELSWAETDRLASGIAEALLERGYGAGHRVMLLSGNAVDHALLTLGALLAGVPAVPVSPAYSLMSTDLAKLRHVFEQVRPAMVYVSSGVQFERALSALDLVKVELVVSGDPPTGHKATLLSDLMATEPGERAREAFEGLGPDTVAKILFTSGSTGVPKGVVNTHRMLCSNQQAIRQCWPFVTQRPPMLVDWLPWHHTFGGNHNFNMALAGGGTIYVDEGKPAPVAVERTIANLREIAPTVYFNVPAGYAAILPWLERDAELARHFFSRLDLVFYAAAALSEDLWQRLDAVARKARGAPVVMTSAWGSTETSPLATSAHFHLDHAGNIGVPAPGVVLKLVPNGSKMEIRVKGPNVTPGYFERPVLTREAFDEDGFYKIGDAGRLADPDDPSKGIVFDGRVAEDFKLSTGTWVSVGTLRVQALVACAPAIQDAVVTGHDRAYVGLLAWPSLPACRAISGLGDDATIADVVRSSELRNHLAAGLRVHNASHGGRSSQIQRVLLMTEPPSIDDDEITDKGYINQRAVLAQRAELVERLYAEEPDAAVIVVEE